MAAPAPTIDARYRLPAFFRRLAHGEEAKAAKFDSLGHTEDAERALASAALAYARADMVEATPKALSPAQQARFEVFMRDHVMAQDIADSMLDMAERMQRGEQFSWNDLSAVFDQVADSHDCEYGVPLPSFDSEDNTRRAVLANKIPLASRLEQNYRTEWEAELSRRLLVRNSWTSLGDHQVSIVHDPEGGAVALTRPMGGSRLRKLMDGMTALAGSTLKAEAEMKAMESLRGKLNDAQWRTYVFSGCFGERSSRSDIHYIFRKGYPTLAISWHGRYVDSGRVLACLCFHPMGYWYGTHAGVMAPTDEVIAALLYMRGDEHGFWKKSGQWPASDTRSGL